MIKKTNILLMLAFLSFTALKAQNAAVIQYINTYKFLAIREMQRTGVPASIKLAQGILETQAGGSDLVKRSNNHFGIKCKTGWSGNKVYHDDDERGECFRAYATAEDSYRDHSDFLKRSQRYAFLFRLDPEDYKNWAKGLKKAGYATNPKYTQQLVKFIETYDLQLYTLIALGKRKMEDEQPMYAANSNTMPVVPAEMTAEVSETPVKALRLRYPEEAFRINDTRVVVALAGTPLLSIAEQFGVKYRHLLDFNELSEADDIVRKDQLVFLQRKRRQGSNPFHLVTKGETLYDIAQEEAIRLDNLLAYNQLRGSEIPVAGQKLYLQKDAAERAAANAVNNMSGTEIAKAEQPLLPAVYTPAASSVKHVVQHKETLFSIARKYGVEVEQVRSWNRLQNDAIRSGQELLIYKN
ncbi:glucosaminidase domain-containing protein [Agriterribacter sp.]|uniref:glucosaminidase domain-containing protein n=1 Tax=Agriterribacter sp. TaxID=2821509 RepID=UPI002CD6A62D|nr:glucosaminidase domain-containing protein [Agriterribacter sp.]HRP56013.1 glucosaminidase domain-containing protein [Agriterribacter sp.]